MKNGRLDDARLEEIADGLMEQFRVVRGHPEDVELEMKISDSMANGAGKILKAYMIDVAIMQMSEPRFAELSEAERVKIGA